MKWIFTPSLGRRLVLSLIIAFVIDGGVILLHEYSKCVRQIENFDRLQAFGDYLSEQTASLDEAQAKFLVVQTVSLINRLRGVGDIRVENMKLQLFSANGRPVFVSDGFPTELLPFRTGSATAISIGDKVYGVYAVDSPRWKLRVAEPRIGVTTVVKILAEAIWPSLLLSFPFILVPVWLAVYQGLRPLRQLAGKMAARDPDDLSPVGVDLKYIELRPVIDAFDMMLEKLRYKVQRERAFVQDAAHELRTPMAVIAAQAHVLARAQSVDERLLARQALDDAIARASHLTRQLLELATLDQTDQDGTASVDVAKLLQQMLAEFAPLALARQIELSLDAPDSLWLKLDAAAFRSIVENLVDNALRYVPSGGLVAVSLETTKGWVILRVADNGNGIDPEDRPHIFERFHRGRGHDLPGTGLGLAIVRKAAQAMGGTINLETGLDGQGVAFVLRLLP